MNVFISWSGTRSRLALALERSLLMVIQAVEPWVIHFDRKGTRGEEEIDIALEGTGLGIICLTRENLESPWMHYEAGALARARERVWTFLCGIAHTDVRQPLSRFQHTLAENTEEVRKPLTSY